MKALVIAPQPFFTPRGTPFSIYYRTLITSELGVKIDLLTYGEGDDVEIPGVNIIRIPRFNLLGNVKVGPSGLKVLLDIFIFFKMMGLLLTNKYDFIHAHEEAVFFAYFLKPMFRYKMVYDMHSSLPQQLTNFNFTKSKLLINIFKKLEDACLKSADAVITICPDLYSYVNTVLRKKEKHFLIENSIFDKVKLKADVLGNNVSAEEKIKIPANKKIILYAGTLESYQGIDILIRAFVNVVKETSNALLLIIGGTPEQVNCFSELSRKLKIESDVVFTGRVPQSIAKQYTGIADLLVSPRSAGTNTPLKLYEQLASGIPLVATNIYSHTQVLKDDVAFLVDPIPAKMAEGITAALCSNGLAKQKSNNARKLYEEKYSRDVYKQKMIKLLEALK